MTGGVPTAAELLSLMSALAHDLRTPLTPIKGYAEIIRTRHTLGPEKTAQYAMVIAEAAARIERSTDMLSGVSALYGGRAEIHVEAIRVADIVAERLDIWRGREPGRSFEGDPVEPGAVLVDRAWFGRALDVLIEQAIRSLPAGSPIGMSARLSDDGSASTFSIGGVNGSAGVADDELLDPLSSAFVMAVCASCGCAAVGNLALSAPTAPSR